MRLSTLAALLTIAAALVFVAPAAASNFLPNPGFEDDCGGFPCDWSGPAWGDGSRDTTIFHNGEASLRLVWGDYGGAGAQAPCISGLSPGVKYDARFWHRSPSPPDLLEMRVHFRPASCSGVFPAQTVTAIPSNDSWQLASATFTAPPGTGAAMILIEADCVSVCNNFETFLDDVELTEHQPTVLRLSSFMASRSRGGVGLKWRTSSEIEVLGFHVYRQDGDRRIRLTRSLLPSRFAGSARGHSYSFLDRKAPSRAARYWLQLVGPTGSLRWQGPIRA